MELSTKHQNQQQVEFYDFTGGLNTSTTEEQIAETQLAKCVNFEVQATTGLLKTVDGTKKLYRLPIDRDFKLISAEYDVLNKHIVLFADNGTVLTTKLDFKKVLHIGRLSSNLVPITTVWEDGLIVASGGYLQYIAGYQMKTIDTSPNICKGCYVRSGRILAFDDELVQYSGVGDEDNWIRDSNDPSSSLFVEAGYKAGGKIIGMVNMSSDILIIKDNGMLFRLEGEFPEWQIHEVGRNVECKSRNAFCNVLSNTFILGSERLQVIMTTNEYGSMKPADIAQNVTKEIKKLSETARLRFIAPLNQIWIIDSTTDVLMYDLKTQSFFKRRFNAAVVDAISIDEDVYIIKRDGVDVLDEYSYKDEGIPLDYELQLKTHISHYNYLLKRVVLACTGFAESGTNAALYIGRTIKVPIPVQFVYGISSVVYDNSNYVYFNQDSVYKSQMNKMVYTNQEYYVYSNLEYVYNNEQYVLDFDAYVISDKRIRYRDKSVRVKLTGNGCKFILNKLKIDVVEV
jgi:hypothetical protein